MSLNEKKCPKCGNGNMTRYRFTGHAKFFCTPCNMYTCTGNLTKDELAKQEEERRKYGYPSRR